MPTLIVRQIIFLVFHFRNADIISGYTAEPGRYPWLGFLRLFAGNLEFTCGGNFILPNVLLTAGHCIESSNGFVYAGRDNFTSSLVPNPDQQYEKVGVTATAICFRLVLQCEITKPSEVSLKKI